MDPDVALSKLRELFSAEGVPDPLEWEEARDLFVGLDEWLSKGGFKPRNWDGK